ncbi:ABC transporter ATP-binding protein, partial [Peribacillus sp. NPDC060186]
VMNDGKVIYQGDPVTIFHHEDLLYQAHLEKPWIFEMFQSLIQSKIFTDEDPAPRTKEELLQKMEIERVY